MAITQAMCTSFKEELMQGIHDMDTDDLKIALYTSSATLGAATTAYSTSNETTGAGYTAGGASLTGKTVTTSGTQALFDHADVTFSSSTITARGALIYNASKANRAIAVYDFGEDKSSSSGDFVIIAPGATADNAIIRIE